VKNLYLLLLIVFLHGVTAAQKRSVSGYIKDAKSGEVLISANVYEKISMEGTISNEYGFYSILLATGSHTLVFSYVGYKKKEIILNLTKDTTLIVELELLSELDEVTVYGSETSKVDRAQMSMVEIPIATLTKIPVLLGEPDVLKVIQLLPGVQSGTEGTSGIYVRGGGPDQNLFLLDGVPVYNANHLFGFFSVFNPGAVKTVKLYKGGFPARFGGRLSSVIDIRMKEGNDKEFKGEFSIGLISSRFSIEGPIIKDKTSFIISGRRTYLDILAKPVIKIANKYDENSNITAGYYFYDLNAKINHRFSDRSRLFFSSYLGLDKAYSSDTYYYVDNHIRYDSSDKMSMKWGNMTNALRWNYVFNPKLFSNLTLTYSKYNFNVGHEYLEINTKDKTKEEDIFEYLSGITDVAAKIDFDYYPLPSHSLKFGIGSISHTFEPGVNHIAYTDNPGQDGSAKIDTTYGNESLSAYELRAYSEDIIDLSKKFKLNLGLHFSAFHVEKEWYASLEPRISLRFLGSEKWSLKASYARMSQYIHLLSTSTINLPTDLWLPVTKKIKPQYAHQVAVGGFLNLPKGFDLSAELFYKSMDNLIEYKEGASFAGISEGWESKVEVGKGWAYGFEVLLEKNIGKTTGWLGYTWSKTDRQFEAINFGRIFPAKYDRRHDISIALTHTFSDRVDLGITWVYGTGNATTLALQTYPDMEQQEYPWYFYGQGIEYYGGRNNYRMPSYHRLDLGVNFHKQKKQGIRTWSVGLYNAYSRQNPFFLYWGYDQTSGYNYEGWYYEDSKRVLKQVSLFPLIPSVSYTFKF